MTSLGTRPKEEKGTSKELEFKKEELKATIQEKKEEREERIG